VAGAGIPIDVKILDKEYRVACGEGEQESLLKSARFLDDRMREIRRTGKVVGTERIAVMAALNLAYEILEQHASKDASSEQTCKRLRKMQDKIDIALHDGNQLEL
jgi:cell division protein ZapA